MRSLRRSERHGIVAAVAGAGFACVLAILFWMPVYVSSLLVMTVAIRWCIWLESRPIS